MGSHNTNIGWHSVTALNFHNISDYQLAAWNLDKDKYFLRIFFPSIFYLSFLIVADDQSKGGNKILEGFHDFGALPFLEILETASDDHHTHQHNAKIKLEIED
jgi:hypothetical protein